jgi:prolyl-tRNA editing enzyme YbaK/EbsC (Cys-tRNA(Pro) deacylase)
VDKGLAEVDEIIFNAGSHTETIKMKFDDFRSLVNPEIIEIAKMATVS